jgi:alkylhydroperoxidase family enzyme
MARIEGVRPRRFSLFLRPALAVARWTTGRLTKRRMAEAPEPTRILAHRPLLMASSGAFEMSLLRSRALDLRVKELARMRAGMLHGCPW